MATEPQSTDPVWPLWIALLGTLLGFIEGFLVRGMLQ